jgi:hypothetical protein
MSTYNYATYDDLITRYPIASKWSDTETQITSFISYAESELNGLLGTAFTVPFTAPIPMAVTDLTLDLAYARKALTMEKPDEAKLIREAVYERIQRIKDGKEVLLTPLGVITQSTERADIWSSTSNYQPVHTMLDAENAHTMVDSSMLQAEEDART